MSKSKNTALPKAGNPLDDRLEAIKQILIGNQFEKIDDKMNTLTKRIEGTNSRLVSIVDEVTQEMINLKEAIDHQPTTVDKSQEDAIKTLQKELHLLQEELEKQRSLQNEQTERILSHQEQLQKKQERRDEGVDAQLHTLKSGLAAQEAKSTAHERDMNRLREKFASLKQTESSERLSLEQRLERKIEDLPESVSKRLQAMDDRMEHSFESLEGELAAKLRGYREELTADKEERELWQVEERRERESMQEEVESHLINFDRLMERKFTEVDARLHEGHTRMQGQETRLNDRMDKVDKRLGGIHDLLEEEVFHYFEDLKKYRADMKTQMQNLQDEYRYMLDKALLKMEARIESLYELNEKQIRKISHKVDRKKDLRTTLKRLNDLLDDD